MDKPDDDQSYIVNCTIQLREGDVLFVHLPDGRFLVHLDGYAIIPVEEWQALKDVQRIAMGEEVL